MTYNNHICVETHEFWRKPTKFENHFVFLIFNACIQLIQMNFKIDKSLSKKSEMVISYRFNKKK